MPTLRTRRLSVLEATGRVRIVVWCRSDTVGQLKETIMHKTGIWHERQVLTWKGCKEQLDNNRTLASYNICDQTLVQLHTTAPLAERHELG